MRQARRQNTPGQIRGVDYSYAAGESGGVSEQHPRSERESTTSLINSSIKSPSPLRADGRDEEDDETRLVRLLKEWELHYASRDPEYQPMNDHERREAALDLIAHPWCGQCDELSRQHNRADCACSPREAA